MWATLGGVVVSLVVLRRRKRAGPMAIAGPRRVRSRSTVGEIYDQVGKLLGKAGHGRATAETPRELAARLRAQDAPGAARLAELTDLYYAAEWGGRRDPAAEDRAAVLAREIRAALQAARKHRAA